MTSDTATTNLRSQFSAAGLARLAPALAGLRAGSLRLKTHAVDEQSLALGQAKLGGLPDLPAGVDWPTWNKVPLGFIAQIHLNELSAEPGEPALPPAGWLYFFYDGRQQVYGDKPDDRGAWQVIYQPDGPLSRAAAPSSLPDESRFKACAVTVAAETTLPQRPLVFAPQLGWTPDEQHHYEDFIEDRVVERGTPRHRLLGHADALQDDMHLQCQLLSHGVPDEQDPGAAALAAGALNWLLLLQVDSDDAAGMQWGSAGRLYFWIEQAALAARRFDNVWMVMQSD